MQHHSKKPQEEESEEEGDDSTCTSHQMHEITETSRFISLLLAV